MRDQAVNDFELAGGAVLAGEAAKQRFDEVVDEAGEDAGSLGGVEALDLVPPPLAPDLVVRRFKPAGDELFVEAWGAVGGHSGLRRVMAVSHESPEILSRS